jgi:COP9 signalosome complex subunit 5
MSLLALTKLLNHTVNGNTIEVMGTLHGRKNNDIIMIMDVNPLPVIGTETRVNAGDEA